MTCSRTPAAVMASILLFASSAADAALDTYTDHAAFMAALPGPASTLDFDSLATGTTIANGSAVGGITFNYDFGGIQMQVGDFGAKSTPNALGTDVEFRELQNGDDFNLSFGPINAVGMFFITTESVMSPDSITLSAGGGSVGLSPSAGQELPSFLQAFFLGIIDDTSPFTTANITTSGPVPFAYNVDDITTSVVPLPAAAWLFVSGIVSFGLVARQRGNFPA